MTYQDIQANIEYRDRKRKIDTHTERVRLHAHHTISSTNLYLC
jgi:hypothetical protein